MEQTLLVPIWLKKLLGIHLSLVAQVVLGLNEGSHPVKQVLCMSLLVFLVLFDFFFLILHLANLHLLKSLFHILFTCILYLKQGQSVHPLLISQRHHRIKAGRWWGQSFKAYIHTSSGYLHRALQKHIQILWHLAAIWLLSQKYVE